MKRIILFSVILLTAVSCLNKSGWSQSYTLRVTFEFDTGVYTSSFDADSLFYDKEGRGFAWGNTSIVFNQKTESEKFCGGFLMSYQKGLPGGTGLSVLDGRYRPNSPAGAYGSKTYAVFYDNSDSGKMPEKDIVFTQSEYGTCTLNSCMVNNTALVAGKVKEHFEKGDKLLLKATGYLAGTKTGEAEFVLADFSSQKDSIVSAWTKFDLGKLGSVDQLDFKVISPKDEVPGYFCMDEFVANIALESK